LIRIYFLQEFAITEATWLELAHKPGTCPGKIETIYKAILAILIAKLIAEVGEVHE